MTATPESNVIGFKPGLELTALGQPRPDIVDRLEELLAQAKAGQIQGFAFVAVDYESAAIYDAYGDRSYTQLGA